MSTDYMWEVGYSLVGNDGETYAVSTTVIGDSTQAAIEAGRRWLEESYEFPDITGVSVIRGDRA